MGKCKNLRNTPKLRFSEKRRQRVSQAKKRYSCYIEKNIVIFMFKYLRYTV